MTSFSPLLVVAVALVDAEGRVLLQQRPPGKPMAGLWEFPGGKVEPGETPEAALVRELEEELGIETQESCLAPASFASEPLGDRHLLLLLYVCRKWRGVAEARAAGRRNWANHQSLPSINTVDDQKRPIFADRLIPL